MHLDELQQQLDALMPGGSSAAGPSRRSALKAALGMGYAAAAMPVLAQDAIRTPAGGLIAGEIAFEVNGFQVPAYRAAPAARTRLPVVLLVHEVYGVHEYIADTARRLAHAGYLAIAPELFARQGDPGSYGEVGKLIAEVVDKAPDAQVMADLDGAARWAAAHGGDGNRLGVTGFCWGGRIVWLYGAHNPRLKAGVAWYGRLVGAASALTPQHPVDVAPRLLAPVLGLYAGDDAGIAPETVERMKTALAGGGPAARASRFMVYPEAPHAFHADYRPSYRRQAAEHAWALCLAWLHAQGVAP